MELTVSDNTAEQRFELRDGGELLGVADYVPVDGVLVLTQVVVEPDRRGQGLGADLVRHTLDQIRARGGRVRPQCPFAVTYLRDHPEYADLLAPSAPPEDGD